MPTTGTRVARTEFDRLKRSIDPERSCESRSVSEPSWLAGNRLISTRPCVAARMRSIASFARTFTGCVGSWPVASLSVKSAANARRGSSAAPAAAPSVAFMNARRLSVISKGPFIVFSSLVSVATTCSIRLLRLFDTTRLIGRLAAAVYQRIEWVTWSVQPGLDRRAHRARRNAVLVVQRRKRARIQERIGQGDLPERRRDTCTQQRSRDGFSKAPHRRMVFSDDEQPAAPRRLADDRLLVEWLDRRNVKHAHVDPIAAHRLGHF